MLISCPACSYEKDTDPQKLNFRSATAKCPKCNHKFRFSMPPEPESLGLEWLTDNTAQQTSEVESIAPDAPAIEATALEAKTPEPKPAEPKVIPLSASKNKPQAPAVHKVSFEGKGLTLLRLYVVNNLLALLTLGVYHFWGKAKIRKYLYSSTELLGERFSFTGTGKELFVGWLKAACIFAVLLGVPNALSGFVHPAFAFLVIPIMFILLPAVMVGAWRYKLSRAFWHGASFSFKGAAKEYMLLHIKGTILTIITFGLYAPYFHAQKESFWRTNSNYGTASFGYSGKAEDIRKDFLKAWLLTIPTLGLCWFWYSAKVARYDWEHTSFSGANFNFDATGRQLFSFTIGNFFLLALTLGFAYPWVIVRGVNFLSRHLSMKGEVDFNKIAHAPQSSKAVGEGLAGVLDIDMAM
ncbi:MAG: hypothetical protein A2054_00205 [Deltaproteobacteria bacterium GWA2_55_10]|nr:MAG: hypothetical protein A2054_00205 [Deltaproteobacteria bacterium GWA2_55_10]